MDAEFYKGLNKALRKEQTSLKNRLQSILLDHRFLSGKVRSTFPDFPVVPNERCGLWYCSPDSYNQTSYFKSTDGHTNQWDFSVRRLNLHLLPTLRDKGGIIIVDSTRRGKKIPDALSKTIPIWCAVLNIIMLEYIGTSAEYLFCPPGTVSALEKERIDAKLPELVSKLKELLVIDGRELHGLLKGKLLRPFWVYPGSSILEAQHDIFTGETVSSKWELPADASYLPIILCTVSYQCQDGMDKRHGFTYVQGAADDHELWAQGLAPRLFWENLSIFSDMQKSDQALQESLASVVKLSSDFDKPGDDIDKFFVVDKITEHVYLGCVQGTATLATSLQKQLQLRFSLVVMLSERVSTDDDDVTGGKFTRIYNLSSGSKKSSRELRLALVEICPLIYKHLHGKLPVLVCCDNGKDMSVSVILAVLAKYYTPEWELSTEQEVHKALIKRHLIKMIKVLHGRNINPSRASLNSVNAYLM
ncbi:LAMI_0G01244g1_1 [Lachancea mirantina]|uniref:LAMI_0G01244g1_1 n=1 Tax=Lachancea mirantina TaxID=1230905 RepID=A0A1G4K7D6_9SACH|nr:LAMI_0G01244g1_1 [Lachancea mirantina]